jgi:putative membrane protein
MILTGPIFAMLALISLVAIFVWMVDRASGGGQLRRSALDILGERFARGEIDRTEYEEKRKLIRARRSSESLRAIQRQLPSEKNEPR